VSGIEWLVEAFGCVESRLRDPAPLADLFAEIVAEMGLKPLGEPVWHRFPSPGGVTGVWLLSESHLTVHSFPEFGSLCLNVFCCRAGAGSRDAMSLQGSAYGRTIATHGSDS